MGKMVWNVLRSALVLALLVVVSPALMAQQEGSAPAGGESVTEPPPTPIAAPPVVPVRPASAASPAGNAGDEAVKMTRPGTFTIHVQGADLRGVLQQLSTQGRKNIVASKDVTGSVTADLYDVTFKEALDAVLRATGYGCIEKGNFIYVYTLKQIEDIRLSERKMAVRMFRLSYLTADDAKTLLAATLSKEGTISVTPKAALGISPSKTETGSNSYATDDVLVIRDYEENLEQIAKILKDVDVKPEQVLIEATLLRASLDETTGLGIDVTALSGINFSAMGATSDIGGVTNGTVPADRVNNTLGRFTTDFKSSVPAGGLTFGVMSSNVGMFVRALEAITDVTVMANPKLLVVNRQRGEVMVGNRDGYLTTTVSETVATQTVQFLETGTRLIVRPFIGANDYIRLEIHPEDSSGSVKLVGTSALPSETTTEVTSNVLVRDGRTIVIGGLFRERTQRGRTQVPLIGNVPYVGTLFRATNDETIREEVIALITPRIVKQAVDEAVSGQLKDDAERYRIGARKGLQWFSRERLAVTHLRWAKKDVSEGRNDLALLNLDLALSMAPRMQEAITMKERLLCRAYWANEPAPSSTKDVVERMVMQELHLPQNQIQVPYRPRNDNETPDVKKALGLEPRVELPIKEQFHPSRPEYRRDLTTLAEPAPARPSAPPAAKAGPTTQPAAKVAK